MQYDHSFILGVSPVLTYQNFDFEPCANADLVQAMSLFIIGMRIKGVVQRWAVHSHNQTIQTT